MSPARTRSNRALPALLLFLCACSGGGEAPSFAPGDYAVHRYSGSYRKDPVTLRRSVVAAPPGGDIIFLNEWESGGQKRTWREHIAPRPYDLSHNLASRLELPDGKNWKEIPNPDNMELFRLREGTLFNPQGLPRLRKEEPGEFEAGGKKYHYVLKTYRTMVGGKRAVLTRREADGFKWGKFLEEYKAQQSGEVVFRTELIEEGSRKP
ncbi:MAG: hypothetical protein FD189_45 [Elusimicrobia bacterium]|nr:MAG: hypothetical protein FD154_197 [Elusimicrobiota bacterium]KAF0158403.1 MAG: hypothetical protein FD189_45 [Elusimicrobiota bacterium]